MCWGVICKGDWARKDLKCLYRSEKYDCGRAQQDFVSFCARNPKTMRIFNAINLDRLAVTEPPKSLDRSYQTQINQMLKLTTLFGRGQRKIMDVFLNAMDTTRTEGQPMKQLVLNTLRSSSHVVTYDLL